MNEIKLDLKGWGPVHAEILWIEGHLYKIKFVPDTKVNPSFRTEIFHVKEILNIGEIFIDKNLNILKYDTL
jgi:hypothetical protein